MKLRARSLAALLSVGIAFYTQSARADAAAGSMAAPTCQVQAAPYGQGIALPSNAPALLLADQSGAGLQAKFQGTLVVGGERKVLDAPAKDSHGLLALALPTTAAGEYSLEVAITECKGGYSGSVQPPPTKNTLTLTAPVTFPTTSGVLTHVPQSPPTGIDKIRFEPTTELRAFLPAARLEVTMNGKAVETRLGPSYISTQPIELAVNTGDVCIEDGALHREKRIVKVSLNAAIAGVASTPTEATIDVPVDCGAIQWTAGVEPGKNGAPGSSTPSGSTTSSSSAGGCSAAPASGGSFAGSFALIVAAVIVAKRRRRAG